MRGTRHILSAIAGLCMALALAGCGTTKETAGEAPAMSPLSAMAQKPAPVKGAEARFAFAPISGPPVDVLRTMSAALNKEAKAHKLNVVPTGDPSAIYEVRGYLSAVDDHTKATLVYVWDVFDATGIRLHRISGQLSAEPAADGDPWTGVDQGAIDTAAKRSIAALAKWAGA